MNDQTMDRIQHERADRLFAAQHQDLHARTDRMFAKLMVVQWVAGIAAALWISPRTWAGTESAVHTHVWLAIFLGGAIAAWPVYQALTRPGARMTRHSIAVGQALTSALLIHLTGGRIETHFHVFGSLAFLSFYRDVPVLLTATVVTALDHWLRGVFLPQSVFGILAASEWRWLEHAGWVVFEDFFLIIATRRSIHEMRDVCQRRAELEITKDVIEQRVAERTVELERARDEALEAVRIKSEFLANMSHEIRTPMNGVLGFVDLMLAAGPGPDQRGQLETIRGCGHDLLAILSDILDFSAIEAGKLRLQKNDFELRELVGDVASLFEKRATAKGLDLIQDLPPAQGLRVSGDGQRLRQVLFNIIGNAVKFTERGHVALIAAAHTEDDGKIFVRFRVEDTGIGIPEDKQQTIFRPFTQVDGSSTRRFGGTGLGLAISRRLIEMMGGTIGFTSTFGKGTAFSFDIRLDRGAPPPPRVVVEPSSQPVLDILVVDDNAVNRKLASAIVQKAGHRFETAKDGREAVVLAAQRKWDVILMDVQMPEMDGLEATAAIRMLEGGGRRTPIIALTARALPGDRDECLAAGMDDYLTKPVNAAELTRTLQRWSSAAEQTAPRARAPAR